MSRQNSHIFSLKKNSIILSHSNTDNGHEISAPPPYYGYYCDQVPIPNPDQVNLHRVNLVFDPLLPFFVLFFKTMFVSFFNLRIILYMCDLGTHLESCAKKVKGRQSFQHH